MDRDCDRKKRYESAYRNFRFHAKSEDQKEDWSKRLFRKHLRSYQGGMQQARRRAAKSQKYANRQARKETDAGAPHGFHSGNVELRLVVNRVSI